MFDDDGTGTVPADALANLAPETATVSMGRADDGYEMLPGDYLVYAYAQHSVSWQARIE
ncbi:MAG: hypothetical protein H0V89_08840 [Deltaproteobacteria bacterium]|nr:hypothetical protein [Deltaproteobacteria bacterium]